jgi:hypothetical protein
MRPLLILHKDPFLKNEEEWERETIAMAWLRDLESVHGESLDVLSGIADAVCHATNILWFRRSRYTEVPQWIRPTAGVGNVNSRRNFLLFHNSLSFFLEEALWKNMYFLCRYDKLEKGLCQEKWSFFPQ